MSLKHWYNIFLTRGLAATAPSVCLCVCLEQRDGARPSLKYATGRRSLHVCVFLCTPLVQIYRCVHMFARRAKYLIQVGRQKRQTAKDCASCYRCAAVGLSRAYSPSGA